MRTHPLRPNLALISACLLALLFFIFGITMPTGHFWGGFLLPILAVFLWGRRRDIYIVTALATILLVITFWINGATVFDGMLVSHLLSVAILWAAAWLLAQRRQLVDREQELAAEVAARTAELGASEQRYRLLAEHAGDLIWTIDMDGSITYASPAAQRVRGVSREEEQSASWFDRMPPATAAQAAAALQADLAALRAGQPIDETPHAAPTYRKDGTLMWTETIMSPLYDDAGRPLGLCGTTRDITARHEAEEALRRSEERFSRLFDATPTGIVLGRQSDHSILDANKAFAELTCFTREELTGHTGVELGILSTEARGAMMNALQEEGWARSLELQIRGKSGAPIEVEYSMEPIDIGGEACFLTSVVDVTARKAAERERLFLSALVASSPDTVIGCMVDGTIVSWNRGAEQLFGYTAEEAMGQNLTMLSAPDSLAQMQADIAVVARGNPVEDVETQRIAKDGRVFDCRVSQFPVRDAAGEIIGVASFTHDISERKRLEAELLGLVERWDMAAEISSLGIWDWHAGSDAVIWDERMYLLHGLAPGTAVTFAAWRDLIHPNDRAAVVANSRKCGLDRTRLPIEYRVILPDGSLRHVLSFGGGVYDAAGTPVRQLGIGMDISERKRGEEHLRASEEKFARLFAANPAAMCVTRRADDVYLEVNDAYLELTGYTRGELIGRPYTALAVFPANYRADLQAVVLADGRVHDVETQISGKWGTAIDCLVSVETIEVDGASCSLTMMVNITERKRAEAALAESEAQLRAVIENTKDTIWSVGRSYRLLIGNSVFTSSIQRQINRPLAVDECVFDDPLLQGERAFWQPLYDRALAGESSTLEMPANEPGGGMLACFVNPISAADGTISGVTGRVTDITALKRAEAQLHEAYQRVRLATGAANIGIWNWNFADNSLEWDERMCAIYGVPADECPKGITYDLWRARVHPDDRDLAEPGQGDPSQLGSQWSGSYRIVLPGGDIRYLQASAIMEYARGGSPRGMIGINRDITDQVLYEQLLQNTNAVLEQQVAQRTAEVQDLYDSAPTGFHTLDTNGCFVRVNQTELNWLGYTRDEVIGRSFAEFVTPAGQVAFRANFPVFKQRGWARDIEYDLVRKDGTTFPVLVNASAVYDEQGSYVASRGTLYDNTERQRAELALRSSEEALRLANSEMARALRLKDEFLAMISHELRTPLTGILSMSEMLEDQLAGPLNARQATYVRRIVESGERLLNVLNSILGYTHLLSGKVRFDAEPCELAGLLEICAVSQERKAAVQRQIIAVHVEPPELVIIVDATALADVLKRLLDNAVKFTPEGGQIGLEAHPGAAPDTVALVVWDTGIGIAPDQLDHIFHAFTQADARLARSYEGIGLGLAYVDQMVRLMGGTIAVESMPGKGSRFTVILPT